MKVKFYTTLIDGRVETTTIDATKTPLGVNVLLPAGEGNTAVHILSPEFLKHYGAKYSAELRGDKSEPIDYMAKFGPDMNAKKAARKAPRKRKVARRT